MTQYSFTHRLCMSWLLMTSTLLFFACSAEETDPASVSSNSAANNGSGDNRSTSSTDGIEETATGPADAVSGNSVAETAEPDQGPANSDIAESPASSDSTDPGPDTPEELTGDDDGDGLDNAEEAVIGTNPNDPDTDKDGYTDWEENHAGTDPLDAESVIYKGGWPYNPNKDDIANPGWNTHCPTCCFLDPCCDEDPVDDACECVIEDECECFEDCSAGPMDEGTILPRYMAYDQYGDMVDIYDLAGHGVPIVLDIGTWFCKPCKGLAAFFTTGDDTTENEHTEGALNTFLWWSAHPEYSVVYDLVQAGEVIWVTVLFSGGIPVDQEDVTAWHDAFPNEHILVLADSDMQLKDYLEVTPMPSIHVLSENMEILVLAHGPTNGMKYLSQME